MDILIDNHEDVAILVKSKVMINTIGSNSLMTCIKKFVVHTCFTLKCGQQWVVTTIRVGTNILHGWGVHISITRGVSLLYSPISSSFFLLWFKPAIPLTLYDPIFIQPTPSVIYFLLLSFYISFMWIFSFCKSSMLY